MAELDIGKRCGLTDCKQLDFLPIQCVSCLTVFCKLHQHPDSHSCSHNNDKFDRPKLTGEISFPCEKQGCNGRELIRIVCEHCNKTVCLEHKHQIDHDCEKFEAPKERMKQSSEHVRKILAEKEDKQPKPKPAQGRKSKATSLKVALMKIKMKAVGDSGIPAPERVYFQVHLPKGSKGISKPMFFSHFWTIGRVIDKIASLAGLRNDNNTKTAPKLRLFSSDTGKMFQLENSLKCLIDSAETDLASGCSVITEFVDDDTTCLTNFEDY